MCSDPQAASSSCLYICMYTPVHILYLPYPALARAAPCAVQYELHIAHGFQFIAYWSRLASNFHHPIEVLGKALTIHLSTRNTSPVLIAPFRLTFAMSRKFKTCWSMWSESDSCHAFKNSSNQSTGITLLKHSPGNYPSTSVFQYIILS